MSNFDFINKQFESFEKYSGGILGVSAVHIEKDKKVSFNEKELFLMCSTYKLPIAIYLLHLAEQEKINLDEHYIIREVDLRPGFAFTLNDFDCKNGFPISLRNLLLMMLRESCNTSTDVLLRLIGGPNAVTNYLNKMSINSMTVDRYTLEIIAATDGVSKLPTNLECTLEEYKQLSSTVENEKLELAKEIFINDKRDSSTPLAMTNLLVKLFNQELIATENIKWLLSTMRRNKLYPNRIMGLLPYRTPVAHKTGTATGHTNDVGIITLPHQLGHIAITAFIKRSNKDKVYSERALAEVSRTVYDYFLLNA